MTTRVPAKRTTKQIARPRPIPKIHAARTAKARPPEKARTPRTTKSAAPGLTATALARFIGSTQWLANKQGPLRMPEGVFLHAYHCHRIGDEDGVAAFAALTPKDWWVPLLDKRPIARREATAAQIVEMPFTAPLDGDQHALHLEQLTAIAWIFPSLTSAANRRIAEGFERLTECKEDLRIKALEQPFRHLVRSDLALAKQAAPWLASENRCSDSGSLLRAYVQRIVDAGDTREIPAAVKLGAIQYPDADLPLTAAQWREVAPAFIDDRLKNVDDVLDYLARTHPSLRARPPEADYDYVSSHADYAKSCVRTKDLERLRRALGNQKLRDESLELAVAAGLVSIETFLATTREDPSRFAAWHSLWLLGGYLRELGGDPRERALVSDARRQVAAGGPRMQPFDFDNWHQVLTGEARERAIEASDPGERPALLEEAVQVAGSVPPLHREAAMLRLADLLVPVGPDSSGHVDLAIQMLASEASRHKTSTTSREQPYLRLLGRVVSFQRAHDPNAAFATFQRFSLPKRRTSCLEQTWSVPLGQALSLAESIAPTRS